MQPKATDVTSAETRVIMTTSASSIPEEGRFVPGSLLAGRYRIVALLGRGGMGEVYRATDLTLGQTVALKFLPEEASRDQRLLERFHSEVRVARQVSHPNVCRVYDIGEADGTPFISMEYVDGEDLTSLLTRIGRLPADKAIETARKICAGLAAAHDRGIVHRDLKPQNIMMNKRGEVIIMDFGLAAIASQLGAADVRSGTPAYMAPEQLKGSEVTARSDIYSLGLVLYELFTGKRPYEARTIREMLDLQEAAQLTSMTSVAADIDPGVERAIRRCLDPEPSRRPATALAVAAALPGGDPLAAALAAGETPSPELVANAGATEGLARRYSVPLLAVVVVCLFGNIFLRQRSDALQRVPHDLPPAALAAKAREIASSFGYPKRPVDSVFRLDSRGGYVDYLNHKPEPRRWNEWLASESPLAAGYRESPKPLLAFPDGVVGQDNPAPIVPGMVYIRMDGYGRLMQFEGIPYTLDDAPKEPVAPETVFRAAGYDFGKFQETSPQELPVQPFDQLRAWKGPHPTIPDTEVVLEIASLRGRITRARVMPPWSRPNNTRAATPTGVQFTDLYQDLLVVLSILFAILFARRNWKLGRVDRKGAARVSAARFVVALLAWFGSVHLVPSSGLFNLVSQGISDWLFSAAIIYLLYFALEPSLRARWPHSLVTWNRIIAGRWLDPQVGAHILIGAAVGCVLLELLAVPNFWLGPRDTLQAPGGVLFIEGVRQWLGGHAARMGQAITVGMSFFFALSFIRTLARRDWIAAIVASVLGIWIEGGIFRSSNWQITAAVLLVIYFALFLVMLRFGLVATVTALFFVNSFNAIVLGYDWTAWYAPYGLATLAMLLTIVGVAFVRSLGSRSLFGGDVAAEPL